MPAGAHTAGVDYVPLPMVLIVSPNWNMVSFNVEPAYPLVGLVLDSIDGRYDRVLGESGIYDTALEPQFQTLTELHAGEGYYVHMTSTTSANLLVDGLPQAADTSIDLHQGWNWIGYYPDFVLPVGDALGSIAGLYQFVHSLEATYDPSLPQYSTLMEMEPGQGNLIYMTQAAVLTYPASVADPLYRPTAANTALDDPCGHVTASPEFTVVYGDVSLNGAPVPVGTKIEVVTPRGEVAGCRVVTANGILGMTHVYGAYQGTVTGFEVGEEMAFLVNGI